MSSTKTASGTTAPTELLRVNGQSYAYRRFGKGPGLPLLFLQHGSSRNASCTSIGLTSARCHNGRLSGTPNRQFRMDQPRPREKSHQW
jgi:hypothetical protein